MMNLKSLAAWLIVGLVQLPALAQTADEAQQIQILQSEATPEAKEDACRRLKLIGTTNSLPALAALLPDQRLYQSACDALETMPSTAAGQALLDALKITSGKPKAGIIHALGERRDRPAVQELAQLLDDSDSLVATSAARALGRIGGDQVIQSLQQALKRAPAPVRRAIVDALLNSAAQLVAAGHDSDATLIFQQFTGENEKENVRIAAYAGLLRASGDRALPLVVSALLSADQARQSAALQLAGSITDPKATAAFTNMLVQSPAPLKIALLRLLQQRDDASASPAAAALVSHQDSAVRVAAITALGILGDASAVQPLAGAAASSDDAVQNAARQALVELRRGKVGEAMIAQLIVSSPEVQVELIRALTLRMDKASAPQLLELARTGNPAARRMALRGLEQLASSSDLPALVALLQRATDEASRNEVQGVFESLADRTGPGVPLDVRAITAGLNTTDVPARIALLQVSAFFADDGLRAGLRAALRDQNTEVRRAAARALCGSRDVQLMPDLLVLAGDTTEPSLHALALEGYVRLVGDNDSVFPTDHRVRLLQSAYKLATRPEEKRQILSALATAPNLESLRLAEGARSEPEIRTEADVACVQIAKALLPSEPTAAMAVLRQMSDPGTSPGVQATAQSILKGFDSGWLYAGPYRQAGLECPALFDHPFTPELPDTQPVEWKRAPGSTDLARRGEVDLQHIVAGDHCVVYLKTRVFAPTAQQVLFELGSDDGIKLWVNGELVHANNKVRGLTPGEDRANAPLRSGWNDLFVKLTQATAGCGMTLVVKNPDGSEIPGLHFGP